MKKIILAASAVSLLLGGCSEKVKPLNQKQVGEMATSYFMANPHKLLDLFTNVQNELKKDSLKSAQKILFSNARWLIHSGTFPVIGNTTATKTLLFFFDFQCKYCHMEYPLLKKLVKENQDIKVVFIPLDFFGPGSVIANHIAFSLMNNSDNNKDFIKFYDELTKENLVEGALNKNPEKLVSVLSKIGINKDTIEQKIKQTNVQTDELLNKINTFATKLKMQGTPYMALMPTNTGKTRNYNPGSIKIIPGYISFESLKSIVEK